jgi:hypothetical protein
LKVLISRINLSLKLRSIFTEKIVYDLWHYYPFEI